jgi:hypothetical protein
MLLDSYARQTQTEISPAVLPLKLAPGAYYWQARADDELAIRLRVGPRSRVEVDIWWNRRGDDSDIQLVCGIYGDSVEIGSLTGNGFDAPCLHRAGFGTLAVNIGVQALQAVCRPSLLVHGVLSNTTEEALTPEQRNPLETSRRVFWRRFGLDVVARGSPPMDYLRGNVGGLRLVSHGHLAGQFARNVELREFARTRPEGF